MTYYIDQAEGTNPHVNDEPSALGGLREAAPAGEPHTPYVEGHLVRQQISRENNYQQAGERYRTIEQWERDDLINNLVAALKQRRADIQERMVNHFTQCDPDYGRRVTEGVGLSVAQPVGD
jgi:catalase